LKFPQIQLGEAIGHDKWRSFYNGIFTPEAKSVIVEVLDTRRGAPQGEVDHLRYRADKLSQIQHPNISRMLAHGAEDGFVYLAIEKESDTRLADHLTNGDYLPPLEATRLVLDMAYGIKAIHELGVVHGELRPSNVLFSENGQVKLRNVFQYRPQKELMLELVSRRPHYVSPEHIRMEPLDFSSDQYALGIMYFQLLTGRPPYDSKDIKEIWKMHLEGDIPTLPMDLSDLEELEDVVRRMLAKRPKYRYVDDEHLIAALEDVEDYLMMLEEGNDSASASQSKQLNAGSDEKISGRLGPKKPRLENPKASRSSPKSTKSTDSKGPDQKAELQPSKTKTFARSSRSPKNRSDKPSSRGVAPTSPRAWKKGGATMLNHGKPHRSRAPETMSKGLMLACLAAVVMIVAIVFTWINLGLGPEDSAVKEPVVASGPKFVIKTRKEFEAESLGELQENGALKQGVGSTQVLPNGNKAIPKPTVAPALVAVEDQRTMEEKERDEKIAALKELSQKPLHISLPQIEVFLEDKDTKVRLIANQLYRDLKGGTLLSKEDIEKNWSHLDLSRNLETADTQKILASIKALVNNKEAESLKVLQDALTHEDEEVQQLAIKVMYARKDAEFPESLVKQIQVRPWDKTLYAYAEALRPQDILTLKNFTKTGDARDALGLIPFWVKNGPEGVAFLTELLSTRTELSFPLAFELAALGESGREILLNALWAHPSDQVSTSILSALRESALDKGNVMRLEMLMGQLSPDINPYLNAILASRGRSLPKEDNTPAEFKALVGLDDMSSYPTEDEISDLLQSLGLGNKDLDLKILKKISSSGDLGSKAIEQVVRGRYTLDLKRLAIDALAKNPTEASMGLMIELVADSQTRVELVKELKDNLSKLGATLLPVLVKDEKVSAKDKVELIMLIAAENSSTPLVSIVKKAGEVDARKALQALLDGYPVLKESYDALLQELSEPKAIKFLLSGLSRSGGGGGLEGSIDLLAHEDSSIRSEAFASLKQRLTGDREEWYRALKIASDPKIKTSIISHLRQNNPSLPVIIEEMISHADKSCREAILERMQQFKSEPTIGVINRLVLEDVSFVKAELIKYFFSNETPHPMALIWGQDNLSSSLKKKIGPKLTELALDKAKLEVLSGAFKEPYQLELRIAAMKFLIAQGQDIFEVLFAQVEEGDESTVKIFRQGMKALGAKVTAQLVKKLDTTRSVILKDEIEVILKEMKVNYVLDPKTGRYIVQ
jgi:serine/threonine protein kinase